MLHADTCLSKSSPLKYLESFLTKYVPHCPDKCVFMDQGGELYHNPAIKNLFKKFGYEIYPTSPDASYQNGQVEKAHCTFSQGVKTHLFGTSLDVKF